MKLRTLSEPANRPRVIIFVDDSLVNRMTFEGQKNKLFSSKSENINSFREKNPDVNSIYTALNMKLKSENDDSDRADDDYSEQIDTYKTHFVYLTDGGPAIEIARLLGTSDEWSIGDIVFFMDGYMPIISGPEAVMAIRKLPRGDEFVIIANSTDPVMNDRMEEMQGADARNFNSDSNSGKKSRSSDDLNGNVMHAIERRLETARTANPVY